MHRAVLGPGQGERVTVPPYNALVESSRYFSSRRV